MFHCNVMNLAKHTKQTAVPEASSYGTENLSRHVSSARIAYDIEALSGKRIQSLGLLSDNKIHAALTSAIEAIVQSVLHGGKTLIAGNGGSASQSQHLCSELMGRYKDSRFPIKAISLCSDVSLLTCIANDFGYERVYSRQIEGIGEKGDVFVAFTTSGKSRNILEALCECKSRGIPSIVFSGQANDTLNRLSDIVVPVPVDDSAIVQEIHLQLVHILCETIERQIDSNEDVWEEVVALGRQGYEYLILDRDGVINSIKANGYIKAIDEFRFRQDFVSHIKELSMTFSRIFVVTNQKGVGKGLLSIDEVHAVHDWMEKEIRNIGGRIDKIYVSTSSDNYAPTNKPNTGMADLIKSEFPEIDFSKTVIVGDSASDYLFADNLKSRFIYVRTR